MADMEPLNPTGYSNDDEASLGFGPHVDTSAFAIRYVTFLRKRKNFVIGMWACFALLGVVFSSKFIKEVDLKYNPPSGTPGDIAENMYDTEFPGMNHDEDTILLVQTTDGSPILEYNDSLKAFFQALNASITEYGIQELDPVTDFQMMYFYLLADLDVTLLANSMLQNPQDPMASESMIAALSIVNDGISEGSYAANEFADHLDDEIERQMTRHIPYKERKNLKVVCTGMIPIGRDLQDSTEHDMLFMDGISFPIALIILAVMLNSFRLLLLPILSMACTLLVAYCLMYPIAKNYDVIAVAPSIMMSVSVAFSVDYSLFLLTRFREEINKDDVVNVPRAVTFMIDSAGHTIMISGFTIILCWMSLMIFPVSLLSTIGVAAGVCVCITFCVNVSLIPVLLLKYPDHFSQFGTSCTKASDKVDVDPAVLDTIEGPERAPVPEITSSTSFLGTATNILTPEDEQEMKELKETSEWYALAICCVGTNQRATIACMMVSGCILPLMPFALNFHHSASFVLMSPRGYDSTEAAEYIKDTFGGGRIAPYSLVVEAPKNTPILSNKFYLHMQDVIVNVLFPLKWKSRDSSSDEFKALLPRGVFSLAYLAGQRVSFTDMDDPHQLPLTHCLAEAVETGLTICAQARCESEMASCQHDPICRNEMACIKNCGKESDPLACAILKCGIERPLGPLDFHTVRLATCVQKRCIPRANAVASDMLQMWNNYNGSRVLATHEFDSPVDCMSVVVQTFQQVQIKSIRPFKTGQYSWILMNLETDPFDEIGDRWIESIREALDHQTGLDGYKYYLAGGDVAGFDMVDKVYGALPTVAISICSVVFCLVGFAFKSLLVPTRALYTIVITLSFVYGLAVLVYEHGMLDWTGIVGFKNPVKDSLCWIVPTMEFAILIGLSLDYDIFLLERVFEYHQIGASTRDSILCGLAQTGRVITAAGVIMTFAFGGLFFSSNPVLNQCSLFLCSSVIIDTFVVRTILVPAIMILLDEWNWWPAQFFLVDERARM